MKKHLAWSLGLVLMACALGLRAGEKKAEKNAALERFKGLAGEWAGIGKHGDMEHDIRSPSRMAGATKVVAWSVFACKAR
jgi:hypothetical protein